MLWYQGSHLQRTTTITTILHRSFCLQLKSHQKKHVGNIQKTPHLKKKLGQHLLINEKILTQIVQAANLSEMFTKKNKKKLKILEIGPGTGNLTSALLNFDGGIDTNKVHVHAIEYDERMVLGLEERFSNEIASNRLMIEQKDFESFSFFDSQHIEIPFDACIANIPYQLSSLIVARLSQYMHSFPHVFQCAVLLVQDEFALRLLAKPGDQNYSRLSVNTSLIGNVTSIVEVDKKNFLPPPKVNSRVIKICPLETHIVPCFEKTHDNTYLFQEFDAFLRICFLRKNKTLRALLTSKTAMSSMILQDLSTLSSKDVIKQTIEQALDTVELTNARPVRVSVHQFLALKEQLAKKGITFQPSHTKQFII